MGKSRNRKLKRKPPIKNKKQMQASPSISMVRPETNSRLECVIIPEFPPDSPENKILRSPEGSQGIYKVTFVFTIPGKEVFRDNMDSGRIMQSGNSLLQVGQGPSFLKVYLSNDTENAEILFSLNSNREISSAQIRIEAPNFLSAERAAYDLITPQLSYWSFLYDISIDVDGYEVIEEKTQSKKYSFGVVGRFKNFDNFNGFQSIPSHRKFFSAYREGMNATNVFYQALSFYKVSEGIVAERKREQRRQKGEIKTHINEKFPASIENLQIQDEFVKNSFTPYLGQDFDTVLKTLSGLIRNAIAHLSQLDGVLDPDKFDDVNTCSKAIPVLRFIAHKMLENDIAEYQKLNIS